VFVSLETTLRVEALFTGSALRVRRQRIERAASSSVRCWWTLCAAACDDY